MNVAIIPARFGSKRIPQKNIKLFCGKPAIHYPVLAALESNLFDRVIVSTDSEEIANVALQAGAEVPFLRPSELADDHTITADVIVHALNELNKTNNIKYACCIYATAVFVRDTYLKKGYEVISKSKARSVFSVTTFPFPIFRSLKINAEGNVSMFWPEHMNTRSNDLEEAYHDAGQFYWLDAHKFLEKPCLYTKDAKPVILPRHYVQDIDTLEDWERAEYMYKAMQLANFV